MLTTLYRQGSNVPAGADDGAMDILDGLDLDGMDDGSGSENSGDE